MKICATFLLTNVRRGGIMEISARASATGPPLYHTSSGLSIGNLYKISSEFLYKNTKNIFRQNKQKIGRIFVDSAY